MAILISLVTESMIKYFKAAGVFAWYAAITFVGFWYVRAFILETEGLTDRQKKMLYLPRR